MSVWFYSNLRVGILLSKYFWVTWFHLFISFANNDKWPLTFSVLNDINSLWPAYWCHINGLSKRVKGCWLHCKCTRVAAVLLLSHLSRVQWVNGWICCLHMVSLGGILMTNDSDIHCYERLLSGYGLTNKKGFMVVIYRWLNARLQ